MSCIHHVSQQCPIHEGGSAAHHIAEPSSVSSKPGWDNIASLSLPVSSHCSKDRPTEHATARQGVSHCTSAAERGVSRYGRNCNGTDTPSSTGWLHNMLEDNSIPIRVANVTKNELALTDGLVVPSSCIFLNGNVFLWNPPVLDPMNVMPNGRGWEEWTDDVWSILEVVNPRPGSYHPAL